MRKLEIVSKPIGETALEAYKTLRTNLRFCKTGSPKTITVTSCLPGEGKSLTAFHLALSMAESGLKVLLIDADMRKAQKSSGLNPADVQGLSALLSGLGSAEDSICSTDKENLYFLPSGCLPRNPAELVSTGRFHELLMHLLDKYKFDKVIIDTPSVGSFTDGAVIAAQTDGILLVARCKRTKAAVLRRTKEQLEKLNTKILGVVLNMMPKSEYRKYNTFDKYYRYYNKDNKGKQKAAV